MAKINEMGDMPAVRTEEILYHHSLVLDALGRMDEGETYLHQSLGCVPVEAEPP